MRLTRHGAKERDKTVMPDFEGFPAIEIAMMSHDDVTIKRLTRNSKKLARQIKLDIRK